MTLYIIMLNLGSNKTKKKEIKHTDN